MRSGYQLFINLTYAVVLAAACPRAQRHLLARLGVAESLGRDTRKDARHRRQVADVAIDHAEKGDDGSLVSVSFRT